MVPALGKRRTIISPINLLGYMGASVVQERYTTTLQYWQWLSSYLWLNGFWKEYESCAEYALEAAKRLNENDPKSTLYQAVILSELAWVEMEFLNLAKAKKHADESLRLFMQLDDASGVARVLRYQATIAFREADYPLAEGLCMKALRIVRRAKHRGPFLAPSDRVVLTTIFDAAIHPADNVAKWNATEVVVHNLLGCVCLEAQLDSKGFRHLRQGVNLAQGIGYKYYAVTCLVNLAHWYQRRSRVARAKHYYTQCLEWLTDGSQPDIAASALLGLAVLEASQGNILLALEHCEQAGKQYDKLGKYADKGRVIDLLKKLRAREPVTDVLLPLAVV